jgi:hypothetical protein
VVDPGAVTYPLAGSATMVLPPRPGDQDAYDAQSGGAAPLGTGGVPEMAPNG